MPSGSGIRAGRVFVELFADNSRLVRGLRMAESQIRSFGQKVSQLGQQMLITAGAAAAPLGMATAVFGSFEDQMKAVQAVTGATGKEFDRLYEQAKRLGRTTSFTAGQVGAGQLSLARAGFNPAEIEAAIPGVLNLARATGTELAVAADIAGGTLRAFALEATEMGRVTDVLVATANNSAQTLEDLGESMKYAAPIAEEYGLSLEETSKVLGVLANMQIKGSMAGTSLRMAMLQLADPGVRKRIEALGVAVTDAAGNLRTDLGTMMLEIGQAMQGMGSGERLALFKDLFGQRAAGGMAKLAKADFPALAAAIDNAGGTAERTAKVMDSGLGGAFRRMLSAVEGVQIAVGEALAGALGAVMDRLSGVAVKIAEVIKENKQWVIGIGLTVAAIGAAGASLIALGLAAKLTAFVFGGIAAVISTVGSVLGGLLAVVGALLTPIGAVSAALVAVAGYFVYASGTGQKALGWLGEKFRELRDTAGETFQAVGDALAAGDLPLAAKVLWATLKVEWQKGVNALSETWTGLKQMLLDTWTDAVYGLAAVFIDGAAMMEDTWARFTGAVIDKWKAAEETLAKGIAVVIAKAEGLDPADVLANVGEDYAREREARKAATRTRRDEIEAQRQDARAILRESRAREKSERAARYGAALAESAKELDALKRERDAAIQAARQARERATEAAGADKGSAGELATKVQGGMAAAEATLSRLTAGTFSAQAAQLLGGGRSKTLEEIAKESTEQRRLLERIDRNMRTGALLWAGEHVG